MMPATEQPLTEEVRHRIRTEEIFRSEVQKEIASTTAEQSFWSKVFGVLNKPFTLWILSSVFLGLVSFGYTKWEEGRAARAENRAEVVRLDIEIYGRLQRCRTRLMSAKNSVGLRESIKMLDQSSGIFPEYEKRSFDGLLLPLKWLVSDEEKADIENARVGFQELQKLRNTPEAEVDQNILLVKREYLDKSFAIRKWGTQK